MSQHNIDYRNSVDTGETDAPAIVPITDGEPAVQANLRRPTENNRFRSEVLRKLLREHVILSDMDRNTPMIFGGGTITFGGAAPGDPGTFVPTGNIHIAPFATPGDDGVSSPYIGSTTAKLSIGTPSNNEVLFTSIKKQFQGTTFPHADANKISIEILHTGALTVNVQGASGEENNIVVTIDSGTTTCTDVINAVNGDPTASLLVLASLGAGSTGTNACALWGPTEWAGDYTLRFLAGGAAGVTHTITPANLSSFFGASSENLLKKGDTLAIWYDKLIEEGGTGGRFQSTSENANQVIPAGSLFNTRREPEKIPNCVPICKCVDQDVLLFINGAVIVKGTPANLFYDSFALTLGETSILSTPLGWDRLDTGDHSPPTTLRQAFDNADKHTHDILNEIEAARTADDLGGAYANLDARFDRVTAHASVGAAVYSVSLTADSKDTTHKDAAGFNAAVGLLNAGVGGTIYVRAGTYDFTTQPANFVKPIRIIAEGQVIFRNNLGIAASNYMFHFGAGSNGSYVEGISITETGVPSNQAIIVDGAGTSATDITFRNCHVLGMTRVRDARRIRFEQCTFDEGTNGGAPQSYVVDVSGIGNAAARKISFHECRFIGAGTTTTAAIVYVGPSTSETLYDQTQATQFFNCEIDSGDGITALYADTNGGVLVQGLNFKCRPYTTNSAVLKLNNTAAILNDIRFHHADFNPAWKKVITNYIKVTNSIDVYFRRVHIDGQVAMLSPVLNGENPIYLEGQEITLEDLEWFFAIPSTGGPTTEELSGNIPLIMLAGSSGGRVTLKDSRIRPVDVSPVGSSRFVIVATNNTTSGFFVLDNVFFDLSFTQSLLAGSKNRAIISTVQNDSIIRNCRFKGGSGIFGYINFTNIDRVTIKNNRVSDTVSDEVQHIIVVNSTTAGGLVRGLYIQDNIFNHLDTTGAVVDLDGNGDSWYDLIFTGNTVRNEENNTAQVALSISDCEIGIATGNMIFAQLTLPVQYAGSGVDMAQFFPPLLNFPQYNYVGGP